VCHQTVSLIARHLEGLGIPTLCMAGADDIIRAGWPPRSVFLDYPLGHTTGKPFAPDEQYDIVRQAMAAFDAATEPGQMVSLDYHWSSDSDWKSAATDASAGDQRAPRDETPRYQHDDDRVAAEAATAAGQ